MLKTYLIKENAEDNRAEIRKAEDENEVKKILEMLRFGYLILEMCTGIEMENNLMPGDDVLRLVGLSIGKDDLRLKRFSEIAEKSVCNFDIKQLRIKFDCLI